MAAQSRGQARLRGIGCILNFGRLVLLRSRLGDIPILPFLFLEDSASISFDFLSMYLTFWFYRVVVLVYLGCRKMMLRPGFEAWRAGGGGSGVATATAAADYIIIFLVIGLSHSSGDVRVGHVGILAIRRTVHHRAMMRWVYSNRWKNKKMATSG